MSFRTYKLPMSAGVLTSLPVMGRYVRPLKATGEMTLYLDGSEAGMIAQGIGVHIPSDVRAIGLISPIAQTVELAISDLPVDDGRLSFDSVVSIRDENRTLLGTEFFIGVSEAVSTDFPVCVIKNPSGSGKTVSINDWLMNFSGQMIQIAVGIGNPSPSRVNKSGNGLNKKIGDAVSSAVYEQGGDFVFPAGSEVIFITQTDANLTPFIQSMGNAPIVLNPGAYVWFMGIASSGTMNLSVGFSEE